jgi:hypothetical protein
LRMEFEKETEMFRTVLQLRLAPADQIAFHDEAA